MLDSCSESLTLFVQERHNAIIICPGVAGTISAADIEARRSLIEGASVFVAQLEQPMEAAHRGLAIARAAGVCTILNPAPAAEVPAEVLALCDFVTPNETEAAEITGLPVDNIDQAATAAEALLRRGVGAAIITLGENGALYRDRDQSLHVPAFNAGPVVETTGAGDAFNGALAAALADGATPVDAVRFGCAAAGISVNRPGTAPSMPSREEISELLIR